MTNLKQTLAYLLVGQTGGKNRYKILELLKERPYNINQISKELDLNYRTVKHHVEVMQENDLLTTSGMGDYGEVYFLTERLENNFEIYENIANNFRNITASPALLQNLLKQSDLAVILTDEEGTAMYWNTGAEKIFGYEEKEILGKDLDIFEAREFIDDLFEEVREEGQVKRETEVKDKSGETKYVNVITETVLNEDGEFLGYSILAIDITKRKETEKGKEKQYNVLQTIMENTNSQLVYFDKDFNFVYANTAYAEGARYSKEELIGRNHFELFPDEENREIFEKVRDTGEPVTFNDKPFEYPDDPERGTTYWDWTLSPVKNDQGEVQGLVLSLIETTERVRSERKIKEKNERIEFLNSLIESIKNVNQELVKNDQFDDIIEEVPSILMRTKGFMNITLMMFDDKDVIRPVSNSGVHDMENWKLTRDGEGENVPGCIEKVVKREEEIIVEELKSFCEECPVLDDIDEHQTAVIPMFKDDLVIGAIRACYEPDIDIDERTLELLREVSGDLSYAWKAK
ncbi:MAG: PAS domain S-box protein [Candidatus Thermoplasmatota archaeon]